MNELSNYHRSNSKLGGFSSLTCLQEGARLLSQPQLRIFVLVPLVINFVLFLFATVLLIQQFSSALDWLMDWLPGWLDFLAWILWTLLAFTILLVYGYSFSLITNLIAAPFNGLLAEKIEAHLTGQAPPNEPLSQMIPRTMGRELIKLWYFISRGLLVALGLLLLSFIPGLNLLVSVLGLLWGAWSMAIQYVDYPADNHQLPFPDLRQHLGRFRINSFSFGGLVMLGNMVPLLNIFVMPIAVAGATVFWVKSKGQV